MEKITPPEELADSLESEDLETEIVTVSAAIVLDSEYKNDFIDALTKLCDEYTYLDDGYQLNIGDEEGYVEND